MSVQDLAPQNQSAESEWVSIVENAPEACRKEVASLVDRDASSLASHFYKYMLQHPQAKVYLSAETVHLRLHSSMTRWIKDIFRHPMGDPVQLVAYQHFVGKVHARIQLPLHLVSRGARLIKQQIRISLTQRFDNPEMLARATLYADQLIDMSLELMSVSYERDSQREARIDEAYRLHSIGQDLGVERERQRAVLVEWVNEVMLTLHRSSSPMILPSLRKSEFGIWFFHKAIAMFEGDADVGQIVDIIDRVDSVILPSIRSPDSIVGEDDRVIELQYEIDKLKYLISNVFGRHLDLESGRDALTRLFNRRFLPSVISREICVSQKCNTEFALLLLDLDHFKNVNDIHGHAAGDTVLQQASTLLMSSVRNGDFVFRYGGEELLILLVEVTRESALRVAELIRDRFASTKFTLNQGVSIAVTASIGVAMYDGHPDHQHLIKRADAAMYQAKMNGRNRVELST